MAFQKGQSGNPGGRSKEKAFADAVRLAVHRVDESDPEKRKKLILLAERLVELALAGEGWAMQQIADRLDGKPAQEATVDITTTKYVARVPEKAKSSKAWQEQHSPSEATTH